MSTRIAFQGQLLSGSHPLGKTRTVPAALNPALLLSLHSRTFLPRCLSPLVRPSPPRDTFQDLVRLESPAMRLGGLC